MNLFDVLDPAAADPRPLSVETPLGHVVLRLDADGTAWGDSPPDEVVATRAGGVVQGWDTTCGRLEILTTSYDPAIASDPSPITAMAFVVRLRITQSIDTLRVRFGWRNADQAPDGGYDGGQSLMAATYESSGHRVTLGTDDGEALRSLGEAGVAVPGRIASRLHADGHVLVDGAYDPLRESTQNALVLALDELRADEQLELMFAVAWEPVVAAMLDAEADPCGTWHAVRAQRTVVLAPHEGDP